MTYKAILVPKTGDRAKQIFCASLDEAKKWGRRVLWDEHRKLVLAAEKGELNKELTGPRVLVMKIEAVDVEAVYPWDVTDEDKKEPSVGE